MWRPLTSAGGACCLVNLREMENKKRKRNGPDASRARKIIRKHKDLIAQSLIRIEAQVLWWNNFSIKSKLSHNIFATYALEHIHGIIPVQLYPTSHIIQGVEVAEHVINWWGSIAEWRFENADTSPIVVAQLEACMVSFRWAHLFVHVECVLEVIEVAMTSNQISLAEAEVVNYRHEAETVFQTNHNQISLVLGCRRMPPAPLCVPRDDCKHLTREFIVHCFSICVLTGTEVTVSYFTSDQSMRFLVPSNNSPSWNKTISGFVLEQTTQAVASNNSWA